MKWKPAVRSVGFIGLLCVWVGAQSPPEKAHKLQSVSVRKLADSIHAVVMADRQAYAELFDVHTNSEAGLLPTPAALLRHAAGQIQTEGAEFSYTLRSLWPIRPSAAPQTEVEEAGLRAVLKDPAVPFYREEELGGRSYFTAVYADRATLTACVRCHNQNPASPRRDFKRGDVLGGIVVRVPLEF